MRDPGEAICRVQLVASFLRLFKTLGLGQMRLAEITDHPFSYSPVRNLEDELRPCISGVFL